MAQNQQGGPDEKEKTTALKDLLSRIDLDELMKKDEPPLEFPDTLEGFEYVFNETTCAVLDIHGAVPSAEMNDSTLSG
ncbi:UNVERIFIED_CONTAM: hypothetical protein K2H54_058178 [Gekko kuhli]